MQSKQKGHDGINTITSHIPPSIYESDCKESLGIGMIRALNECTGGLFSAAREHTTKALIYKLNRKAMIWN